jgi:transcriptional regulator with XRE-family HTH domain
MARWFANMARIMLGEGARERGGQGSGEGAASFEARVRERLRMLRLAQQLSLEDVALKAGLTPSAVSRLESGARRLALEHLSRLADALGVRVEELLAQQPRADPRVEVKPFTMGDMTVWPLSRVGESGLLTYRMRIPAQRPSPRLRRHEGREWLYVLEGRLRLLLGTDELVLSPGEAAEFNCLVPHWVGAAPGPDGVTTPVEVLIIMGPQGQRVHLRTRRSE